MGYNISFALTMVRSRNVLVLVADVIVGDVEEEEADL